MIQNLAERIEPGNTVPACECPVCGALAYLDPVQDPLIRLVVEMYGGTISNIRCSHPELQIETIFTENKKYADESRAECYIDDGDEFIFTHFGTSLDPLSDKERRDVLAAANARLRRDEGETHGSSK